MALQYTISSWRQLPGCMSNNSQDLRIRVADMIHQRKLQGFRITVDHPDFGVLFACVINATGDFISDSPSGDPIELDADTILAELYKFGFDITYEPAKAMSGDMIQYLMTIDGLGYDKIRRLAVVGNVDGIEQVHTHVVAFNVGKVPANWLIAACNATAAEWYDAVTSGAALDISAMSTSNQFSWTWLTDVVSIDDLLEQNSEAD